MRIHLHRIQYLPVFWNFPIRMRGTRIRPNAYQTWSLLHFQTLFLIELHQLFNWNYLECSKMFYSKILDLNSIKIVSPI